jgi:transcriptional regulator with XRE-family HTH domain
MLRPDQVEKVRRLLASGQMSLREIAREAQVARNTVNAIARGRRHDEPPRSPDDEESECLGPPIRCAGCGGFVYPPCRLCRVRAVKAKELFLAKLRRADVYRAAG